MSEHAQRLTDRLERWLRREAELGTLILLCVALLAAFGGTLTPAPIGASSADQPAASAVIRQTTRVSGYTVILTVTPGVLGSNRFTAAITDAQGRPVEGALVVLNPVSLEMDMGTQPVRLVPAGADAPGTYGVSTDLTMPGPWQVTITVTPARSSHAVQAVFRVTAGVGS